MKTSVAIICVTLIATAFCENIFQKAAKAFKNLVDTYGEDTADVNLENFMTGMMKGIGEGKSIDDLKKCMTNGTSFLEKMKAGLEAARPMTRETIKAGLIAIFQAMRDLFSMISPCLSGYDKLKKLQSSIQSADVDRLVARALGRIGAFFHLVMNALEGYMKGDYNMAGKGVGDLFTFLFSSRALLDEDNEGDKAVTMEELVKGFVLGVEGNTNIEALKQCIKTDDKIVAKLKEGLETCRPMDANGITKGLKIIFTGLNELLSMLKPCMGNYNNLKKVVDYIAKADINKLLRKIQGTIGAFFHLVMNSLEGFMKDDYAMAGKGLGDLMKYLFFSRMEKFANSIVSMFNFQKSVKEFS